MRIVTVKEKFVKHPGQQWFSEMYVEKLAFATYERAKRVRAMLRKYFGPMEIKRVKAGYALYTRSDYYGTFG